MKKIKLLFALTLIGLATTNLKAQNFIELIKVNAPDAAAYDNFGYSVAVSGDKAIIGSYQDDDGGSASGSAYIYELSGGVWTQTVKLVASDDAAGDQFGMSVAISGNKAIIGAPYDDDGGSSSGSAYIFELSGSTWTETGKLLASDPATYDYFGRGVAISGDTAIVGAYSNDDNGSASGSAYIYELSGSTWAQTAKLVASDAAAGDNFGYSVAISGSNVVIGGHQNDDNGSASGSAYIFEVNAGVWSEKVKLVASDPAGGDYFGRDVSISGNRALIGAFSDDDNGSSAGSAYLFELSGGTWSETQKLLASDGAASDNFGYSVSISDGSILVGAYGDDDGGSSTGSAYFFKLCSPINGTAVVTACDSLLWIDGNTYYATNNNAATFNIPSASGCDSTVTLDLTIINSGTGTDVVIACDSLLWIDGNTYYTTNNNAATFNIAGAAANSCDSLVTLDLTINNSTTGTDVVIACKSLLWIDGNTYTTTDNNAATFNIVGGAANSCDSLVTLDVTIKTVNTNVISIDPILTATAAVATYRWLDCDNSYAVVAGETSQNFVATINGNYAVEVTENGCTDTSACFSITSNCLTVNGTDVQISCNSFLWIDGNTYTSSNNTATFNIMAGATNGCDSLVALDLTIINSATGTDVQTACISFLWIDGNTYTISNNTATFNIMYGAANGCDSLVTLDLTINTVDVNVIVIEPTLTSTATGAAYKWLDCNNNYTAIPGQTAQNYTVSTNGDYAVEITQNGCIDTSSCVSILTVGIEQENTLFNDVSIFPNPIQYGNLVNINLGDLKEVSINVFNVTGQLIYHAKNINTSIHQFELNKKTGLYFVQIISQGKKQQYKLIKM